VVKKRYRNRITYDKRMEEGNRLPNVGDGLSMRYLNTEQTLSVKSGEKPVTIG